MSAEYEYDGKNRTSSGGEWTLLNRFRCWLVGHDRTEQPIFDNGHVEVYHCRRCNDYAAWRDMTTRVWYRTWNAYWDDTAAGRDKPNGSRSLR